MLGVLIVGVAGILTGAWDRNGYPQEVVERAAIAAS